MINVRKKDERTRSITAQRPLELDFIDNINSEDIMKATQIDHQYRETSVSPRPTPRLTESNIIGEINSEDLKWIEDQEAA